MNTELAKRLRLLASAVSVLVLLAIVAVVWVYARVRASLPQLDGTAAIPGLSAELTVERDGLGVPTIRGQSRLDVARALGFLHAQDRFFQMDVWRRAAAGELSEIFGPKTLPHDQAMRLHGFRRIAEQTLAQLPPDQRTLVEAYADGVNAGFAALHEKPFEYIVIRATPRPWRPEDTFLVADAMLVDLQDDTGKYDRTLMALRDQLGPSAVDFFAPLLTPNDAALDGTSAPVPAIPPSRVIDLQPTKATHTQLRSDPTPKLAAALPAALARGGPSVSGAAFPFTVRDPEARPGSNCFALAGRHTATGAGLLASDIHLNLSVPNTWYRACLEYPGHKITGITLPGVPLIIAGSNGHVAWSFTNAYADTGDLIVFDRNPIDPKLYHVPGQDDLVRIDTRSETIQVHGEKPVTVEYEWTVWGPVVGHDEKGRPLAYLWTGHNPAATNLGLVGMEDASDVAAAVDVAHHSGIPAQNMIAVDRAGDVAWTIAGRLPKRVGFDGRLPVSFQYGDRKWDGLLSPDDVPVVTTKPTGHGVEIPAPDGRLWSANQRMIGGDALKVIGDGGYARPSRAGQIREDIGSLEHATPRDLLAVQLDDRALFLAPWHKLLLDTITTKVAAENPVRAELRRYAEKWEGRASVDAISYPIARLFRIEVYTRVFQPIFASCTDEVPDMEWNVLLLESPMWKMLEQKPRNLLDPKYRSWDDLLVAAVDDVIHDLDRAGVRLPYQTWGRMNAADIRHPFSRNLPWFVRTKIDMPHDPLPGDVDMPRVQTPTHGASERFVVSPGHEDEGIFEMPCGQSGHPLSPYYRAGHEAWVHGDPTPFLPGKTEHTLTLVP